MDCKVKGDEKVDNNASGKLREISIGQVFGEPLMYCLCHYIHHNLTLSSLQPAR